MLNRDCFHLRRLPGKFLVGGFGLLLLATTLVAARAPLHLELDRQNGCYGEGETAVLTVRVDPDLVGEGDWTGTVSSQRDWNGEKETSDFSVSGEPVQVPFKKSEPGQVLVTVSIRKEDDPEARHTGQIGMLFQPERIRLSTPEPEDFDAFWNAEKAAWRALPQTVELTPVESPREGVTCWDLTIRLEGKTPVSGYLALPHSAEGASLPALLSLHGAGVRSSSLGAAARFASMGFMALDINAHGLPNGQFAAFYSEQNETALAGYPQRGSDSREDWYFREMYLRIVTAMDFLCERSEWNGRDLVLRGSSQGGGQALAGAGLDSRVTVAAASVPALSDLSGERVGRKAGWPQPVTAAASKGADARDRVLETVRYFDVGLHASRSPAATIISLGLTDSVCPAVGIQAVANELPGHVELLYRPRMAHAIPGDIQKAFDEFIAERVTFRE